MGELGGGGIGGRWCKGGEAHFVWIGRFAINGGDKLTYRTVVHGGSLLSFLHNKICFQAHVNIEDIVQFRITEIHNYGRFVTGNCQTILGKLNC